jgi:hypothetical protein
MIIKNLIDEDFVNYKKPSMFIGAVSCSFKCDKECGKPVCQNSELAKAPIIDVEINEVIERYLNNPITEAVVWGGLEPFDDFLDLKDFVGYFRKVSQDDIVIYTGYYPKEILTKLYYLWLLRGEGNIVIKFGRFIPDRPHKYDELLEIELASDNQFALKITDIFDDEGIVISEEYMTDKMREILKALGENYGYPITKEELLKNKNFKEN